MDIPAGAYTTRQVIRFSHSDPAGIVFYPEFFRMFNDLFEDWMVEALGVSFAEQFAVHQRMFPLVHVEVDFKRARAMGDTMALSLILTGLGRSSMRYTIIGHDDGKECLRGGFVSCVASKQTGSAIDIPDELRGPLESYLKLCQAGG